MLLVRRFVGYVARYSNGGRVFAITGAGAIMVDGRRKGPFSVPGSMTGKLVLVLVAVVVLTLVMIDPFFKRGEVRECSDLLVEVLDYGVTMSKFDQTLPAGKAKLPSDVYYVLKDVENIERTDRIPLLDGAALVVVFGLSGLEKKINYTGFKEVVIFPKEGITSPDGKTFRNIERDFAVKVDSGQTKIHVGFVFDEKNYPYEMVPGEWVVQLWCEGSVLAQQRFELYWP